MAAVPFFAGYTSKTMITTAADSGSGSFVVWLVLVMASAGGLMMSGIKAPFMAFFAQDSGKRPEEAPFNMLLAMGIASGLCLIIGLYPGWFYTLLPFRDQAQEFLVQDLFSMSHVLQQLQLLAFAGLAFMVLWWFRLYPKEQPGVILDVEWLWRKAGPVAGRAMAGPLRRVARIVSGLTSATIGGIQTASRQVFAADGAVSRKVPLSATAIWAVYILGLVLLISLFR